MNKKLLVGTGVVVVLLLVVGYIFLIRPTSSVQESVTPSEEVKETVPVSAKANQLRQNYDIFADTSREVQYIASSTWEGKTYDVLEGTVYAYLRTPLCAVEEKKEILGADAGSFEYIAGNYAKDKNHVYYLGTGDVCSASGADIAVLEDADPKTFKYDSANEHVRLGADTNSVFYLYTLLSGIDPASMVIETDGAVIKDSDTIWFATGNCHFRSYRQGTFSEVSSYKPPC